MRINLTRKQIATMPFLIIFILIPIIEIGVFMAVGDAIGIGWALLFALFTAILGGAIIRYQGMQALSTAQRDMAQAKMPVQEIFDGFCLIAAGATLITPGFVTDTIGFLLLIPAIRKALRGILAKSLKVSGAGAGFGGGSPFGGQASQQREGDNIIEADYERVENADNKTEP